MGLKNAGRQVVLPQQGRKISILFSALITVVLYYVQIPIGCVALKRETRDGKDLVLSEQCSL